MANGDWCCSHCGKTWKEGAEYRRASEKMRKAEPLKER
jgi:ribosomal protein L37AE/L43A